MTRRRLGRFFNTLVLAELGLPWRGTLKGREPLHGILSALKEPVYNEDSRSENRKHNAYSTV